METRGDVSGPPELRACPQPVAVPVGSACQQVPPGVQAGLQPTPQGGGDLTQKCLESPAVTERRAPMRR